MKILWHSVAPWVGTGYGGQTGLFCKRLRDLGHDVAISCYYGLAGATLDWDGIRCYPSYAEHYGTDVVVPHAIDHFGGGEGDAFTEVANRGLIITLGDVWTFQAPLLPDMAVAAWVPVDHETIPPMTLGWFQSGGAIPIAMSRFGERLLGEAGMAPLYVPHGFDGKVFHPADQQAAREQVGIPADCFAVAIVAANVGKDGNRKAFSEQIAAFAELRRRHSDALLLLHTDIANPYGVDVRGLLLEQLPKGSYRYCDQYAYRKGVPASSVADVYRAADVLSNTSWGEGFGIPLVEAQACGTPVVVTDTTAMPELVGAGWKVPGERFWHESQRAWARRPLIAGIVDAYEQAYEQARSGELRALAWAFAQDYDADTVTERYWVPALDQMAEALERRRSEATAPRDGKRLPVQVREADGLLWIDRGGRTGDTIGFADHEAELRPILEGLLPDGGVLLDVGAHVGHWTLRLAGKASHVYAVEANPETASTLRRHLAMNDISNVTVLQVAAWDRPAWLRLFTPPMAGDQIESGSARTLELEEHEVEGPHDCVLMMCPGYERATMAVRLDQHPELQDLERLDLVKVDVEGADIHALEGMEGLLRRHGPAVLIEDHSVYGYFERSELEAVLERLGYTWKVVYSVLTSWSPQGITDEPKRADYLLATPAEAE